MKSMAEINAERAPAINAATDELHLSARKSKLVRSTLTGIHGDRIIAAHGGSVLEAARAVACTTDATNRAHLANLAAAPQAPECHLAWINEEVPQDWVERVNGRRGAGPRRRDRGDRQ